MKFFKQIASFDIAAFLGVSLYWLYFYFYEYVYYIFKLVNTVHLIWFFFYIVMISLENSQQVTESCQEGSLSSTCMR